MNRAFIEQLRVHYKNWSKWRRYTFFCLCFVASGTLAQLWSTASPSALPFSSNQDVKNLGKENTRSFLDQETREKARKLKGNKRILGMSIVILCTIWGTLMICKEPRK